MPQSDKANDTEIRALKPGKRAMNVFDCLTLRENTAMPITVPERPNRLLKTDLYAQVDEVLAAHWRLERRPALWDGQGTKRCAGALRTRIGI